MEYSDDTTFKEDLEAFLEHWKIDHALLLIPQSNGNVSLMGAGLDHNQIQGLLKVVTEHMPSASKKKLN